MEKLIIKKDRFTCDIWTVIKSKRYKQKKISNDKFSGYISLLFLDFVETPQVWDFDGKKLTVCAEGMKWLRILPEGENYTITAMIDEKDTIAIFYIDIIKDYGIDTDGTIYVNDMFLDLIVHPNGKVRTDDMDELEMALSQEVITLEMYQTAMETCERLKRTILYNVNELNIFCMNLFHQIL